MFERRRGGDSGTRRVGDGVSQPPHGRHWGPEESWLGAGAGVLGTQRWLAAPLASTHWVPGASFSFRPRCANQKCLWTWPHVPWGHGRPWLRATGLRVSDTQWALTQQNASAGARERGGRHASAPLASAASARLSLTSDEGLRRGGALPVDGPPRGASEAEGCHQPVPSASLAARSAEEPRLQPRRVRFVWLAPPLSLQGRSPEASGPRGFDAPVSWERQSLPSRS